MAKARHGEAQSWAQTAAHYTGDDCLLWPFSTCRGYAAFAIGGKSTRASRYVCELAHGKPAPGMDAAHNCGTRLCCNPRHLRWATRKENEADKKAHGTDNRGERHGRATLGSDDVLAIRLLRKAGVRRIELARQYKVAPATIYDITSGRRWAWLKGESV